MKYIIPIIILVFVLIDIECFALSKDEFENLYNSCPRFREEVDNFGRGEKYSGRESLKALDDKDIKLYNEFQKKFETDILDKRAEVNMKRGFTKCYAYAEAVYWLSNDMLNKRDFLDGKEEKYSPLKVDEDFGEAYFYDGATCLPRYAFSHFSSRQAGPFGKIEADILIHGNLHQIHFGDGKGNTEIYYYLEPNKNTDKYNKESCDNVAPKEGREYFLQDIIEIKTPKVVKDFGEDKPNIKIVRQFNECFC